MQLQLITPAEKVFRQKEPQEVVIAVPKCLAGSCVQSHVIVQQSCWKDCHGKQHCDQNESKQETTVCNGTFKIGLPCNTVAFCLNSRFSTPKCHSAPKSDCHSCGHVGQCGKCSAKSKQCDEVGSLLAVDPCCLNKK